MSIFRILSIDGGGLKGILPAIFIERLNTLVPGWLGQADVIAGTSTGGIIALGLASGADISTIRNLYEMRGKKIFDDSWLDNLRDMGKIMGADYDNTGLQKELIALLGKNTLLRDLKKRVIIPSFDLDNESPDERERMWKPKVFHNFPGKDSDAAELAWKVGLYTSAAPTYFPSVDGYVDGGVFANNPAMCALAQSQDSRSVKSPPALSEVRVLSLGTGKSLKYITGKNLDWGYGQWAKPVVDIMMDGVDGIADYQCKQMLGDTYHRLAPDFPPGEIVPLDDVKKMPWMARFAGDVNLKATEKWLQDFWM